MKKDLLKPKLKRPKILLIDTDSKICDAIRVKYSIVDRGTFGTPESVSGEIGLTSVIPNWQLPNHQRPSR